MRVTGIDFPTADEKRLREHVSPDTVAFIAPNHPEFLTDWLLDKELSARHAPLMASWATHEVVNGMGAAMQWFWLGNNLIAQIPGAGGAAAKAHSIGWALAGHAVLLHPEGSVAWTADRVQPLFGGIADMAIEAVRRTHAASPRRRVLVVPVVWRYRFTRDVHAALGHELDRVERKLNLPGRADATPAERMHDLYLALLARDESLEGVALPADRSFAARQRSLLDALASRLGSALDAAGFEGLPDEAEDALGRARGVVRRADRWLRDDASKASTRCDEIRTAASTLRFDPAWYASATLTQEQVAESLKRLRADYCFTGLCDDVHRFVPRPVGPRVAHLRVPAAIDVTAWIDRNRSTDADAGDALLAELRGCMQRALDDMAAQIDPVSGARVYPNPFL